MWVGGERCQHAQKQFIMNTYSELILCKPVGKYQFRMACIKGFSYDCVPSNQLSKFSTKTYIVGTQNTVAIRQFFFKHEIIG